MNVKLRDAKSVKERRGSIEEKYHISLSHVGEYTIDDKTASSRNCENMIGITQVPLGVAGPLHIKDSAKDYMIPLATTEGALVASVSRGCKAIIESDGVKVIVKKVGITRAPVFVVSGIEEAHSLVHWVEKNLKEIKKVSETSSQHLQLLDIKPFIVGKNIYLRFRYDSQDAMGMNMATIASDVAAHFIEKSTKAKLISLSGNMCTDKKPNMINFIEGRGYQVWAEAVIPSDIVKSTLKSSVNSIAEVALRKIAYGSIMSGSIGANAQMANVLAAIFLATGQDLGHLAECSIGVTTIEKVQSLKKEALYISIYLPELVIGTVGGGTGLATQLEALSLLGVAGGNNGKHALEFAQIIGGAVLAGELSLLASLSEGSLATAHKKLARGGSI